MKREEYKNHFESMLVADQSIKITDVAQHVDRAITLGINAFWGAHNWWFRLVEDTLTITEAADAYDLPDDFDSFVTVREQSTTDGRKLQYYPKERFDEMFPKLSAFASGYPQSFTIFKGESSEVAQIAFYPRPTSATVKLLYNTGSVRNPEIIPSKYQSGVAACIAWHCFPYGHPGRRDAYTEARDEIERLRIVNKVDESNFVKIPDGTTDQMPTISPYGWIL